MSPLTLSPLWAVRLSITTTCPGCRLGARASSTYASKTALVVAPSTAKDGPIPQSVMLESNVTFFPQLRGAEQYARSPLGDQAYSGRSETFVEHSSTNTKRSACVVSATIARQTALRNSSRSLAPTDLFFGSIPYARASARRWNRSPVLPPHAPETRASAGASPQGALRGPLPGASSPLRRASVWSLGASSERAAFLRVRWRRSA